MEVILNNILIFCIVIAIVSLPVMLVYLNLKNKRKFEKYAESSGGRMINSHTIEFDHKGYKIQLVECDNSFSEFSTGVSSILTINIVSRNYLRISSITKLLGLKMPEWPNKGESMVKIRNKEFSERFKVFSDNPAWAINFINQDMMDLLVRFNEAEDLGVGFSSVESVIRINDYSHINRDVALDFGFQLLDLIIKSDPTNFQLVQFPKDQGKKNVLFFVSLVLSVFGLCVFIVYVLM